MLALEYSKESRKNEQVNYNQDQGESSPLQLIKNTSELCNEVSSMIYTAVIVTVICQSLYYLIFHTQPRSLNLTVDTTDIVR